MELGPIQTAWIKSLREHPERQVKGELGIINDNTHKCCCLGELLCVAAKLEGLPLPLNSNNKVSDGSTFYVSTSYSKYGLRSPNGKLLTPYKQDNITKVYTCLASMNDSGMTWPQIADYIEANSDNVFEESK